MLLRPLGEIRPYPTRLLDWLEHWAAQDAQRVLAARRDGTGAWRTITYGQMLIQVRRLAMGLATRELSAERPLLILSGNSLEHLTLSFAAMWAGIPYCSVSPAYSQVAGDLAKLQYVLALLTPGLIAAFDTRHYERALAVVDPAIEVVGDSAIESRSITSLEALEAEPSSLLDARHSATGAD